MNSTVLLELSVESIVLGSGRVGPSFGGSHRVSGIFKSQLGLTDGSAGDSRPPHGIVGKAAGFLSKGADLLEGVLVLRVDVCIRDKILEEGIIFWARNMDSAVV